MPTQSEAIRHREGKGLRTHKTWSNTGVLLVLVLVALLYLHIGAKLVSDWYELPDDSHGFLIPIFAGFLLWEKRKELQSLPVGSSWFGLLVLLPALLLLLVGVFGADLFLSRLSFVLLAAGLVWMLLGWPILKEIRFILLVLLLAIPLPTLILNHITFPLQLLASQLSSGLLSLSGVPVLQDGNVIQLASKKLEVAEACSGIRSLFSLLTVAILFGYFMERSIWKRWILALASIPIAVAANVFRIFVTGMCVQYWDPDKAMGFFHEFSGWLMFLVSLAFLYAIHVALRSPLPKGVAKA